MDAAYDSIEIRAHSIAPGHKPIIDVTPRRSADMQEALRREKKARRTLGLVFPEKRRYVERTVSERVNRRLKDEFGGRHVRVRGYDKVLAHLMFENASGAQCRRNLILKQKVTHHPLTNARRRTVVARTQAERSEIRPFGPGRPARVFRCGRFCRQSSRLEMRSVRRRWRRR